MQNAQPGNITRCISRGEEFPHLDHPSAERDLRAMWHGQRYDFERQYTDVPVTSKSIWIALEGIGVETLNRYPANW